MRVYSLLWVFGSKRKYAKYAMLDPKIDWVIEGETIPALGQYFPEANRIQINLPQICGVCLSVKYKFPKNLDEVIEAVKIEINEVLLHEFLHHILEVDGLARYYGRLHREQMVTKIAYKMARYAINRSGKSKTITLPMIKSLREIFAKNA